LSFSEERATTDAKKKSEPGAVARQWQLLKFASLGIEMAVATFIGWGIGYWLDSQLGTEPWLMLVFLLLGVAAGFKGVLRAAREAQEIMRASDARSETPEPPAESKGSKAGASGESTEDRT
jgi:ATP synthase protein I